MIHTELDRIKDKMFIDINYNSIHTNFDSYMRYAELLVKERAIQAELRKATALEDIGKALDGIRFRL